MWLHRQPGSATAQLCPCEHLQSSTSFSLAALSPHKAKRVRETILGCPADLQTLSKQELPENCIHHLHLNGNKSSDSQRWPFEGTWLGINREKKKKQKGKGKKINPEVACLFFPGDSFTYRSMLGVKGVRTPD